MSKHMGQKCGTLYIPNILIPERDKTPTKMTQIDDTRTCFEVHKKTVIYKILGRKTAYFLFSNFKKRYNSLEKSSKLTQSDGT